ncbi:bifunctional metallophosphatase/5'-nucleotidase, partial [Desulfovibrio sp. OttesenSCG-928-G11]|nr:bifunctional metallophosphatase/5'-nucleotidase [Desulfovibrio sp. OttesenSCG-928-G11]
MHSLLGRVGQGPVSGPAPARKLAPSRSLARYRAPAFWLALCAPALVLCCLCRAPALAGQSPFTLTVLHSNDTHSAYGGFDAEGSLCYKSRCPGGQGGYGRLHQAIRAVRRDRPEAILLDAGDFFQGSLYWSRHKAAMPAAVLRYFDYLALVPGNHEFDEGCGPCLDFLAAVKARPLAANLYFHPAKEAQCTPFAPLPEKEIAGQERLRPFMIHEIEGRKIGIIGLVNPETPLLSRPCRRAVFEAARPGLLRAVAELETLGVNIIIALTHVGLEADRELAAGVAGVDIIVGGHDHSLLANDQEGADGPYPEIVLSPEGLPVLIVTAGAYTRHLGRLEVAFDAAGVPLSWEGDSLPLTDGGLRDLQAPAPDPDLEALLESFSAPIRSLFDESLGRIEAPGKGGRLETDIRDCRQGPCPTGDIVARAMLAAVPEAGAALLNSGALRHSLPLGAVTYGDLLESFPFADHCVKSVMSGEILLAALEHGLSGLEQG